MAVVQHSQIQHATAVHYGSTVTQGRWSTVLGMTRRYGTGVWHGTGYGTCACGRAVRRIIQHRCTEAVVIRVGVEAEAVSVVVAEVRHGVARGGGGQGCHTLPLLAATHRHLHTHIMPPMYNMILTGSRYSYFPISK
jgi:hypothetical protein